MKQLGASAALDHSDGDLFDLFIGGEALAAVDAFPPATNGFFAVRLARIDHAAVWGATEWTVQKDPSFSQAIPHSRYVQRTHPQAPADRPIRDTYHIWCAL